MLCTRCTISLNKYQFLCESCFADGRWFKRSPYRFYETEHLVYIDIYETRKYDEEQKGSGKEDLGRKKGLGPRSSQLYTYTYAYTQIYAQKHGSTHTHTQTQTQTHTRKHNLSTCQFTKKPIFL